MGWRVIGRSPSPWYDLQSTREVFDAFAEEEGLPQGSLPNLEMLRRLGRKELIKGSEEWGGIEELAELLEYQVRRNPRAFPSVKLLSTPPSRTPFVRLRVIQIGCLHSLVVMSSNQEGGHIHS